MPHQGRLTKAIHARPERCRVCGCTDDNPCFIDEDTPCGWAAPGLCSHPDCLRALAAELGVSEGYVIRA